MGAGSTAPLGPVVGRAVEQQALAAVSEAAARGEPRLVFVHGEAGVGKTALIRAACEHFPGTVLWGACVPFGASSVPFAALVSAFDGWVADADPLVRQEVLSGLDALKALLPGLAPGAGDRGLVLPQIDAALVRLSRRDPTALVIDDLQWADASSLDLLAFLVNGFRDQRWAVFATVRDDDRPEGHPLNPWLGEIRRRPGVRELHLERLGPDGTAAQVAALTSPAMSPAQAARVHLHSGGNPYLTELLVRDGPLGDRVSAAAVPDALREALLARWHSLSVPARHTTRLLALGGRPVAMNVLEAVARLVDSRPDEGSTVRESVAEAVAAGVLTRPVAGGVWFRHPLIAEVLSSDTAGPNPAPVHSAYAKTLVQTPAFEPGDVASHHEQAGELTEAFEWSLVAADAAGSAQGDPERLEHLHRACRLWPQIMAGTEPVMRFVQLLLRTSMACLGANRPGEGLGLLDQALALTDRAVSPGMACRLLTLQHRMLLEHDHLSFGVVTPPLRDALAVAATMPGTAEQVIVDVASAWSEVWSGVHGSKGRATTILETARRIGSPEALVPALTLMAAASPESDGALEWATEAFELARTAGEIIQMADAAAEVHNQLSARGEDAAGIETDALHGHQLVLAGAAPRGRFLFTCAAMFALSMGRWRQAEDHLRPALAAGDGGHRGAAAHSLMAVLQVRRGDQTRAAQHLAWAAELSSTDYRGTASYPYAHVELLLAQRDPAAALRVIEAQMEASLSDPRDADELLVLAARAAADLAEDARDQHGGDPEGAAEAALRRVTDVYDGATRNSFVPWGPADRIQPARQALYEGELARLRGVPDLSSRWGRARDTCREAGLRWEQARAGMHQGRAALAEGLPRAHVAEALREAMAIADELGALPLQQDLAGLAGTSHIRLDRVDAAGPTRTARPTRTGDGLDELTTREREVLAHVAAGRSNSEIARALFISDKTVSTHVSNILRKSRTSTRVEAAAWAKRVARDHDNIVGSWPTGPAAT